MKKTILLMLFVIFTATSLVMLGCGAKKDTESPVIALASEVPTKGYNGKIVTLPTATATDNVDGDLTQSVKVTVNALDQSGAVKAELVFNKPANVERTFTPSSRYASYKIIYFVSDAAANKAEKVFDFTAEDDKEAPVLTLNGEFNIENGITARADEEFSLPTANGVDKPLNDPMTDLIEITILDKNNEVVKSFNDGAISHKARIIAGEYTCVYSLRDGAGNEADEISFPIVITDADYSKNLLTKENFVLGNSASIDEYNWLKVGMTSKSDKNWDTSNAALNLVKIKDEFVSIKFNIDKPSDENAEFMYNVGAVGSQSANDYLPNADYPWHTYMFIRFTTSGVTIYSNSTSSAGNSDTLNKNLFDGKDHTLTFRTTFTDATETDVASITMKAWVDVAPTAEANLTFTLKCSTTEVSDKTAKTLAKSEFEKLYASRGWLNFMSYTANGNTVTCGDDQMTVKAIAIYPADETEFALTLDAPVMTTEIAFNTKYIVDSEIAIPTATWTGAVSGTEFRKVYLNGTEIELAADATTYTFTATGMVKVVYGAKNDKGIFEVKTFNFKVIVDDKIAPVITVDKDDLNVTLGADFNIPTAEVNDNINGDLTSSLIIYIDGVSYLKNLTNGSTVKLMAEGVHYINYCVVDEAGNETIETVKVTVTKSDANKGTGNILTTDAANMNGSLTADNYLTIPAGTVTAGYNGEYIYNKKVSMLLNSTDCSKSIFLINMRGVCYGTEWLNGLVLTIQSTKLTVSYGGWSTNVFGTANKAISTIMLNKDSLLEFQVTDITVEGKEFVLVRVWLNNEEITFTADGSKGGVVGANGGIMVESVKLGSARYAGNFVMSVPSPEWKFVGVVKELKIDGTGITFTPPVEKPELPTFSTPLVTNPTVSVGDVNNVAKQLLSCSGNQKMITMKISATNYNEAKLFGIIVAGGADVNYDWMLNGLGIRLWQGNVSVTLGTHNKHVAANFGTLTPYINGTNLEMYLGYELEYSYDSETNAFVGVRIRVYTGATADNMTKVAFVEPTADNYAYGLVAFDLTDGVYFSAEKIAELAEKQTTYTVSKNWFNQIGVKAVTTAGPTTCAYTVSDMSVATSSNEPTIPDPTFTKPTVTNATASVGATNNTPIELLSSSGDEEFISMKITSDKYSDAKLFGIIIAGGSDTNKDWMLKCVGLRIWENNISITLGEHNQHVATKYSAINSFVNEGKLEMYLGYTLDYIYANGDLQAVRVTVYTSADGVTYSKLAFTDPASNNPAHGKVTFNLDDGILFTKTDLATLNTALGVETYSLSMFNEIAVSAVTTTGGDATNIFNISEVTVKA